MNLAFAGSRRFKKLAVRLLPERVKARLRAPLYGYRRAEVALPVEFTSDQRGPRLTIDGGLVMRFHEENRSDLLFHFVQNGESIDEMRGFLDLAASARTLFDVGAAKSVFSILFCLGSPQRRAIAFEPSPLFVAESEALAALNGCAARLTIRPCAVGRAPGRIVGRALPNGFASADPQETGGEPFDLEVTSIDDEVARVGVVPDLVKIDVEGYEYEVLLGARRLLREHKPPICLELHLNQLEQRGNSPRDVVDELVGHGYTFRTATGRSLSARHVAESMNAVLRFFAV